MTKFRLNAGRPATRNGGGPSASRAEVAVDIPARPVRIRQNNELDPIPLTCGCTIPYPVITLLGSRPKKVWCDLHDNWYPITKKKGKKCTKPSTRNSNQPSIPDLPPF